VKIMNGYYVEINDGELKLKCLGFSYEVFPGYINLIFVFKALPHQLLKFGTAGVMIDKIKVYDNTWYKYKKYLPVYISSQIVSITQKDHRCTVRMNSLRIENSPGGVNRICASPKCKGKISYLHVMHRLIDIVKDGEIADNIWNNDMVQFLCCYCYISEFGR